MGVLAPDMHQLILPDTKSGHPFTCPLAPPAIAVVQCQQDLMLSKTYIFPRLTDNARPLAYPRATFARICGMPTLITYGCMTCAVPLPPGTTGDGDIAIASHLLNHHSLTATRRYAFHNAATSHAVVSQVIESYDTKK